MANVRFYRLGVLPPFEVDKHKGIFVHVTGTMDKKGVNPKDPSALLMNTKRDTLVQWLSTRHIESIESGLWFGGENGWELLSNETNSAAINAAIEAKIATLHIDGYAQAEISGSTLTIYGIKEDNGIIAKDDNNKLQVAIDGVYTESNKIATQSTVTTAIEDLNSEGTIQAVTTAQAEDNNANTVLTFNGIKEANGKILQGDGTSKFTVGDAKLNIQIGSTTIENVFSANAQSNGAIKLNENVFKKDENNVISVITPTAVASDNKLVTEKDIANLAGAMHYKGALTGAQSGAGSWPSTVAAGDVYIVTTGFTHSGESNPFEVGDMIVFNDATNYNVIQSNITLGTGDGQIAKNVGALADGSIVVATGTGIKTTGISATVLEESNNTRDLSYGNVTGGISIKDSLTVLGKDLGKTINITSNNKSIEIAKNPSNTGVMVDLVWNTIME